LIDGELESEEQEDDDDDEDIEKPIAPMFLRSSLRDVRDIRELERSSSHNMSQLFKTKKPDTEEPFAPQLTPEISAIRKRFNCALPFWSLLVFYFMILLFFVKYFIWKKFSLNFIQTKNRSYLLLYYYFYRLESSKREKKKQNKNN
jgi:hypothetical protein